MAKNLAIPGFILPAFRILMRQNGLKAGKSKNALYKAEKEDYVIMLSHTPKLAEGVTAENVDLQLSGHTHGGQIYPFHYFTEIANDGVLAGFYNKNGVQMYVSRGTRYWGRRCGFSPFGNYRV